MGAGRKSLFAGVIALMSIAALVLDVHASSLELAALELDLEHAP